VRARLAIQLVTLALVAALPSFGQVLAPEERWRLSGALGLDLGEDTIA